MSKSTTIRCDGCNLEHTDTSHARLWGHLRLVLGWTKGPKINGEVTHFCPMPLCQKALGNLRRRQAHA